jgi:hypothetical protein
MQNSAISRFAAAHLHNNITFINIKCSSSHGDILIIIQFESLFITALIQQPNTQLQSHHVYELTTKKIR